VDVGGSPLGIAVSPDGKKVYVANSDDNTTYVIDTATNKVTANVSVGTGPSGIAIGNAISSSTGKETENKILTKPNNNTNSVEQTNGTKTANVEQAPEQNSSSSTSGIESTKAPGFEIISGIVGLLAVFLHKRK
jgi:YVTN family beta-propeller protein